MASEAFREAQRCLRQEQRPKICLLWLKQCSGLFRKVSVNVLREVCVCLPFTPHIAVLFNRILRVYDGSLTSGAPVPLQFHFPPFAVYTWLKPNTLICLGFNNRSVIALGLLTRQATCLMSMHTPRKCPWIVETQGWVYVFGGLDCQSSEKYSQVEDRWVQLTTIPSVSKLCNPCVWQSGVYLSDQSVLQRFDLVAETYTTLCSLPYMAIGMILVVFEQRFVLLSSHKAFARPLGAEGEWQERSLRPKVTGSLDTTCPPLLIGQYVFFVQPRSQEFACVSLEGAEQRSE